MLKVLTRNYELWGFEIEKKKVVITTLCTDKGEGLRLITKHFNCYLSLPQMVSVVQKYNENQLVYCNDKGIDLERDKHFLFLFLFLFKAYSKFQIYVSTFW